MSQSWSIIVFNYNEEETVESVALNAVKAMETMNIDDFEVIVVDDGSKDDSLERISKLVNQKSCFKLIKHEVNKGIGQTLLDGYAAASKENICAIPADGQFDIMEILSFGNIEDNHFVSFYRVENTSYSLFRNILSGVNRWVNRFFVGMNLKDVNWVKIYKREAIQNLDLVLKSSLVESEICAKLIKLKNVPIEVKSKYLERTAGKSRGASFNIVFKAAKETLTLMWVMWNFRLKK